MTTTILDDLSRFSADIVLRNGSTLHVRPIAQGDAPELLALLTGLSADSLHARFMGVTTPDEKLARSLCANDLDAQFGLAGVVGGRIVAFAHYFRSGKHPERAEVAFTISDAMQGCGIGTRLLERLADVAREQDVTTFHAEVLADNLKMMVVFLDSGFDVKRKIDAGTYHVEFSVKPTAHYEEMAAARAQQAATASMRAIFEPRSIAVVGASQRRGQLGSELFHNLIQSRFNGRLYPVNPKADEVEYIPAYKSVRDIPGDVDLAFIIVPAAQVEDVIDDCIAKGVRGVVVITAGFAETGEEGRAREARLVDKIRSAGIRMVGPNCMGVLNTSPEVRMHGTFTHIYPPVGSVAMSTQSGALGVAILDYATKLNIGFSTFISVGNKADVSGNDLIQYWAEDPRTDVILLYLESFGNPKKFGTIGRRVARKKPIVAVKSGRSQSGARAASSHTGALAASDAIVNDLFRGAGIIRTDTLEEMFDVASLLANQPLPMGKRVAILTNAGGPSILAADACEARGLELAAFSDSTLAELRALLPPEASVENPVDMIASANPEQYRRAIELLAKDGNVDSLIVIYIPVTPAQIDSIAAGIREGISAAEGKPVVGTFMSTQGIPPGMRVPMFPFPERAVAALARVTNYSIWRRKPVGSLRTFDDFDTDAARSIVRSAVAAGGGWLSADDARDLLDAARIPVVPTRFAASAADAVAIASEVGFPVVLKAAGAEILHKSDLGGVKLSITRADEVRETFEEFAAKFGRGLSGALVQKMIPGGVEVMVGGVYQPTFGHVLLYGAGGTLVELLSDVAFRIHPVTDVDIEDMLDEVRFTKLLRGFRGSVAFEAGVRDVLMRLSQLLQVCPEIQEMDINPLKVLATEVVAVDTRVRVAKQEAAKPSRRIAY
jgi:acetyl coenzyme A synthetase (ADP forming)-like protein